ncbi:MAG: CPBP family intramembrane metalloprotease [Candidatus Marinimicrobia bacterium]|nr:CPBP family intramembrane metalloprotease [Candidatus Neomarinimicrobiota bacterium]MCF7829760.1 CPBP family intramembrane metalloprotease [Candidatus Neomarinimicrobiota bacterium]MCF7881710.1 CPBP family intramembrane metalloprotease [Candidatus Neomarinimicrobiota bacterium]
MARSGKFQFLDGLKQYWDYTRSPYQSIILILPIIVAYEFGLFLFNKSDVTGIRNGADVLLRYFYSLFGLYGFYAFALSLFIIILFALWLEHQRGGDFQIRPKYFLGMLGESLLFGAILFVLLSKIAAVDIQAGTPGNISTVQEIVLALGAGVYEEFVFRVLVVSGVAWILTSLVKWNNISANLVAVLLSAIVFAGFHYVGLYGDAFQNRTFLLRVFAGVLLSGLYVLRGFGITAYSHIFYDLIIILFV